MYYGQFGMFLLLVFLKAINPANPKTKRLSFQSYTSICLDIEYNTCITVNNKIKCEETKCFMEEKVKMMKDFNFETKFTEISTSEPTSLLCDSADQIVNISDVMYQSSIEFAHSCTNLNNKECQETLKPNECYSPEKCVSYFFHPFCNDSHSDVTSKLQLECLKQKGSCNVEVPRRMIKNYDTCVKNGDALGVVCSDETNYCYAKWAEIKYQCISPVVTTTCGPDETSKNPDKTSKPNESSKNPLEASQPDETSKNPDETSKYPPETSQKLETSEPDEISITYTNGADQNIGPDQSIPPDEFSEVNLGYIAIPVVGWFLALFALIATAFGIKYHQRKVKVAVEGEDTGKTNKETHMETHRMKTSDSSSIKL